jgi:hypothetical protein
MPAGRQWRQAAAGGGRRRQALPRGGRALPCPALLTACIGCLARTHPLACMCVWKRQTAALAELSRASECTDCTGIASICKSKAPPYLETCLPACLRAWVQVPCLHPEPHGAAPGVGGGHSHDLAHKNPQCLPLRLAGCTMMLLLLRCAMCSSPQANGGSPHAVDNAGKGLGPSLGTICCHPRHQ